MFSFDYPESEYSGETDGGAMADGRKTRLLTFGSKFRKKNNKKMESRNGQRNGVRQSKMEQKYKRTTAAELRR